MSELASIDSTLYASVDGMARPLSEKECIFVSRQDGEAHVMTLDVLQAMELTQAFRTMNQHVEAIQARITALKDQSGAVQQVLQHLVSRGLLRRADDALAQFSECDIPGSSAESIGLVLGRRAELILGAMESLPDQRLTERPWLILDGSPNQASETVAERVAALRETGARVHHIDRQWRFRLVQHLNDQLAVDSELLASGLDSSRAGLWNVGLLLSAGAHLIAVNESDRHAARRRQSAQTSWSLRPIPAAPMTLVRNDATFGQALVPADVDPIADQLSLVGSPLHQHAGAFSAEDLAGLSWQEVSDLVQARVLMTRPGGWGDVAQDTNAWVYQTPPLALPHIAPDRESYYNWLRRPLAAAGFDQFQLNRVSTVLPGSVDATMLLPPAPAGARDSQFGFGCWARYLHPDGLVVDLPWMMEYRQAATHQPGSQTTAPALGRFLGEFALVRGDDCAASDPLDRLAMLAAVVGDLAGASDSRLDRMLEEFVSGHRSEQLRKMQHTINQAEGAPEYWRADAKSWIEHEVQQITHQEVPALREFGRDPSQADCRDQLRENLVLQSRWLTVWASLWDYARDQRQTLLDL